MVHGMSNMNDSGHRAAIVNRLAANVSRQEEDIRDWLNGDGQKWLLIILALFIAGFIYYGIFG